MSGNLSIITPFNISLLGNINYSLGSEWINTTATKFFTNISNIPTFIVPPGYNHILLRNVTFTFTTTDAVNLSDLRFFSIYEGLEVYSTTPDGRYGAGNQIDIAAGAFLAGPGTYNVSFNILIGPNAANIMTALTSNNSPLALLTVAYSGQTARSIILSSANNLTHVGPLTDKLKFYFEAGSSANFETSGGAVATTTGVVYGINYPT